MPLDRLRIRCQEMEGIEGVRKDGRKALERCSYMESRTTVVTDEVVRSGL